LVEGIGVLIMKPCFKSCVRSWSGRGDGLILVTQELLVVKSMPCGMAEG